MENKAFVCICAKNLFVPAEGGLLTLPDRYIHHILGTREHLNKIHSLVSVFCISTGVHSTIAIPLLYKRIKAGEYVCKLKNRSQLLRVQKPNVPAVRYTPSSPPPKKDSSFPPLNLSSEFFFFFFFFLSLFNSSLGFQLWYGIRSARVCL